jgi:hypothetical protein
MENESRKRVLIHEGSKALSQLDSLKAFINEQEDPKKTDDYLEGALGNLHFVEDTISPTIEGFFAATKERMTFGYQTLSFFGEVPIMYNPIEHANELAYAFDPIKKPAILTEGILKRLWNANINRNAVKAFGKLSKIELIDRFESHILSSIK